MHNKTLLNKIAEEIKDYCLANANPEIVAKYSRYFKEGYIAYGLSIDAIEEKKKDILEEYGHIGITGFLDLGDILFKGVKYEESTFAVLLLEEFAEDFDKEVFHRISSWFDIGVHNWAHCDFICSKIISCLYIKNIIEMNDFDEWRSAENFYKRRAVPVSLINFLKYQNNYSELIKFIYPLLQDDARTVQQGVGWFLREMWKKSPDDVENLLYEIKDTAPRLIIQYTTEKMNQNLKERFKKEKKS